jgi:hypothetical protein
MAVFYQAISRKVLAAETNTVTFSNIPQSFTDLYCVCVTRANNSTAASSVVIRLNQDNSGTSYSSTRMTMDTSNGTFNSARESNTSFINIHYTSATNNTANAFGSNIFHIPRYSGSQFKCINANSNNANNSSTDVYNSMISGLWRNTAAINSISIIAASNGPFIAGSTFYLYGTLG